jgi:hypothetical protein
MFAAGGAEVVLQRSIKLESPQRRSLRSVNQIIRPDGAPSTGESFPNSFFLYTPLWRALLLRRFPPQPSLHMGGGFVRRKHGYIHRRGNRSALKALPPQECNAPNAGFSKLTAERISKKRAFLHPNLAALTSTTAPVD